MTETRTIESVEHSVETVETTEFQCTNCPNWCESDEIVPVNLPEGETQLLCEYCAKSIFDYDGPTGRHTKIEEQQDKANKIPGHDLTPVMITVVVGAVVLWIGLKIMNSMSKTIAENPDAFAEAAEKTTTTGEPVFNLVGVAFLIVIIATFVVSLQHMPR